MASPKDDSEHISNLDLQMFRVACGPRGRYSCKVAVNLCRECLPVCSDELFHWFIKLLDCIWFAIVDFKYFKYLNFKFPLEQIHYIPFLFGTFFVCHWIFYYNKTYWKCFFDVMIGETFWNRMSFESIPVTMVLSVLRGICLLWCNPFLPDFSLAGGGFNVWICNN